MDAELLLIGHEEDQSDGGLAHCSVGADSQLADGLVEQQKDRVVAQPGDEVAAERDKVLYGVRFGGHVPQKYHSLLYE